MGAYQAVTKENMVNCTLVNAQINAESMFPEMVRISKYAGWYARKCWYPALVTWAEVTPLVTSKTLISRTRFPTKFPRNRAVCAQTGVFRLPDCNRGCNSRCNRKTHASRQSFALIPQQEGAAPAFVFGATICHQGSLWLDTARNWTGLSSPANRGPCYCRSAGRRPKEYRLSRMPLHRCQGNFARLEAEVDFINLHVQFG